MRSEAVVLAVLMTATATACGAAQAPEPRLPDDVRGITISTHRGGQDWGSDAMVTALGEVKAVGANWVAIHPYGRIGADGSVGTRRYSLDETEAPPHIARPIREAHALGLKILIKPHLAYWRSPFSWRGEIGFETEAEWEHFWSEYERFIVQLARFSRDADGFVVGTELRRTEPQTERWRALIRRVRAETDVPLLYAANWDSFETVEFWDALDAIGVQAYFPLVEAGEPDASRLREGWTRWMAKLSQLAQEHDRPVVFTELGYSQSYAAPSRPWQYGTDDDGAKPLQELCLDIALETVRAEPSVQGVFLWKWFPPPRRVGRDFQLATPEMMGVIERHWLDR